MTMNNEDTISIERVEPPADVKRKMNREFLPKNIQEAMISMEDGESFFIRTDDQEKKMYTLRSMVYRHYEKNGKEFRYSLSKETKENLTGIRVYKYRADDGESNQHS